MAESSKGSSPLLSLKAASRKAAAQEAEDTAKRDNAFQMRVAQQQFMNNNAPLFQALARRGGKPEVTDATLSELASASNRLAAAVAGKVLGKAGADLDVLEIKPFRMASAAFVAARHEAGHAVDVDRDAAAIADAVALANPAWDVNTFDAMHVSADASVTMTAAAVAAGLTQQAMIYDFRRERAALVGRLTAVVIETALSAAKDMLAPEASADDRRTLIQSLAKHLSGMMESCFERQARDTVARLGRLDESDRREFYKTNDPVRDIEKSFKEWSECFGGFALAASREMTTGWKSGSVSRNEP